MELIPEVTRRIDTGAVKFGDDWAGVFIRGDHLDAIRNTIYMRITRAISEATSWLGKKVEHKKPPLGIMPRLFWDEQRRDELWSAIHRYISNGLEFPKEWKEEYVELVVKTLSAKAGQNVSKF